MTTALCPECRENVTIPGEVGPEAFVRCPLCQSEYRLADVLSSLPPSLIPLMADSPQSQEPLEVGPPAEYGDQGTGGAEAEPSRDEHSSETHPQPGEVAPAFVLEQESGDVDTAVRRLPSATRSPRRQKNLAVEMGKVVLGGVIGCGLAVLILWWGFGADPFEVGPPISRYAPWLVPAQYRVAADGELAVEQEGAEEEGDALGGATMSDPPSDSHFPAPGAFHNDPGLSEATTVAPDASPPEPDESTPEAPDLSPTDDETGSSHVEPGAEEVVPAPADSSAGESETGEEEGGLIGVRDAPDMTASDLELALNTVRERWDVWQAAGELTSQRRRQSANALYDALARLGEVVTFVDPLEDATKKHIERMHNMLVELMRLPKADELVAGGADRWLRQGDRGHRGVAVIGEVRKIETVGPLFETRLQLSGQQGSLMSVVSRVNPNGFYKPGERMLMIGTIVDDPASDLAGYEGSASQVIMGGYPLLLLAE